MSWITNLIEIINKILDRMPSRLESLKNQRDAYKQELYEIQFIKPFDTIKYSTTADLLQKLNLRIANAGG